MSVNYEKKYNDLVKFLKSLMDEADEFETWDDNMENLASHLQDIGEMER